MPSEVTTPRCAPTTRRWSGLDLNRAAFDGGRHCTAPRLRQSLAALVSGYGLNEKIKARCRLILLPCSLASIRPSNFAQPANFLKLDLSEGR